MKKGLFMQKPGNYHILITCLVCAVSMMSLLIIMILVFVIVGCSPITISNQMTSGTNDKDTISAIDEPSLSIPVK